MRESRFCMASFILAIRLEFSPPLPGSGFGLGGSVDALGRILTRAFLILVVHGDAGVVVSFGIALWIAPLVIGQVGGLAAAEVWREHAGQGWFEVKVLAKPIAQREEAG